MNKIDFNYSVEADGYYQFDLPIYDISSIFLSFYVNGGLVHSLNTVVPYVFYLRKNDNLTLKGSVVHEEHTKVVCKLVRVSDFSTIKIPWEGETLTEKSTNCFHEWVEYVGFTNKFTYCVKCDKKQND